MFGVKHILGLTMLYVMVYAGVSILIQLFQSFILTRDSYHPLGISIEVPLGVREKMHNIVGNFFFRLTVTILVFSVIYVGLEKSAIIMGLFSIYFGFILYSKHLHAKESKKELIGAGDVEENQVEEQNIEKKKWWLKHNILGNTEQYLEFITYIFRESRMDLKEGKYFQFVIGRVGVFFLFLSVSLGVARAEYVKDNVHVYINDEKETYSLYMTTSSGIGLYDFKRRVAFFLSWDNVERLEFIKDKRKTFDNMFEQE